MSDHDDDLPEHLARMLRDVPIADSSVRDAHISAALDQMPSTVSSAGTTASVVRLESRRRMMLAVAAAAIAVLGAGVGYAARGSGPRTDTLAATVDSSTATDNKTEQVISTTDSLVPTKGAPTSTSCTFQVIDSIYVGEYTNPADAKTYAVYQFSGQLEFIDRATCRQVELVGVDPAAVVTTTTP